MAKNQIEKLRKPCLNISQLVASELYNVAKTAVTKVVIFVRLFEASWGPVHVIIFIVSMVITFYAFCFVSPLLFCFLFMLIDYI